MSPWTRTGLINLGAGPDVDVVELETEANDESFVLAVAERLDELLRAAGRGA